MVILMFLAPKFINGPVDRMPYLVPFGTLNIGFQAEIVDFYSQLFEGADPNAAVNVRKLKETIILLTKVSDVGRTVFCVGTSKPPLLVLSKTIS
jgi:hypothetical protein